MDCFTAFGDDVEDRMMAPARNIVSGHEDTETDAQEQLVDDGRNVFVTAPEPVAAEHNGYAAITIGTKVELFVGGDGHSANGNGDTHVPVNGKGISGCREEAEEAQQTLFSWAEFVAESVKPKGRKRKPELAWMSISEPATELERGKEAVGERR